MLDLIEINVQKIAFRFSDTTEWLYRLIQMSKKLLKKVLSKRIGLTTVTNDWDSI
jgi:transposase-like protein